MVLFNSLNQCHFAVCWYKTPRVKPTGITMAQTSVGGAQQDLSGEKITL